MQCKESCLKWQNDVFTYAVRHLEMRESVLDGRSRQAGPVIRGDQQLEAEQLDFIAKSVYADMSSFVLHHTNAHSVT